MGLEGINKDDLMTFSGCCCSYSLLYFEMPQCIGVTCVRECLCIGHECCIDSSHEPMPVGMATKEGQICQIALYCCGLWLKMPTTCIKDSEHCLCLVGECSFPPESDMPCVLAAYGLMCSPKCGCCVPFKEYKK
jgi:hypothetical protein